MASLFQRTTPTLALVLSFNHPGFSNSSAAVDQTDAAAGASFRISPAGYSFVSWEQAERSHQRVTEQIAKAAKTTRTKTKDTPRKSGKALSVTDLLGPRLALGRNYPPRLPLAPSVTRRHMCGDDSQEAEDPGWANVAEVENGAEILEEVVQKMRRSVAFGCSDGHCLILVSIKPPESGRDQNIALCEVGSAGTVIGVPRHCSTVVVRRGKGVFLRTFLYEQPVCRAASFLRSTGAFGLSYSVASSPRSAIELANHLVVAFRAKPLSLEIVRGGTGAFLATASFRSSPILSGYRELLEVNGWVRETEAGKRDVQIEVTIWLNVCRQNSGAASDYNIAADGQRAEYLKIVGNVMKERLGQLCRTGVWTDDYTLRCPGASDAP